MNDSLFFFASWGLVGSFCRFGSLENFQFTKLQQNLKLNSLWRFILISFQQLSYLCSNCNKRRLMVENNTKKIFSFGFYFLVFFFIVTLFHFPSHVLLDKIKNKKSTKKCPQNNIYTKKSEPLEFFNIGSALNLIYKIPLLYDQKNCCCCLKYSRLICCFFVVFFIFSFTQRIVNGKRIQYFSNIGGC